MIDKDFFKRYQKQLLWVVNTSLGRRYFKIDVPKDKKITEFRPNSFTYHNRFYKENGVWKEEKVTDFRTNARFALRLNNTFAFLHKLKWAIPSIAKPEFAPFFLALTTSTFYPAAGSTSPVDGWGRVINGTGASWSTLRSSSASAAGGDSDTNLYVGCQDYTDDVTYVQIYRSITLFDTSSISTDTISSATYSLYALAKLSDLGNNPNHNVYAATTASNSTLANTDFDIGSFGSTTFATAIAHNSITTSAYNDWTLNASGLAAINKTGISKFGALLEADVNNSAPGVSANATADYDRVQYASADTSGTTQDPKLVVVHAAAVSENPAFLLNFV